MHKPTHRSKVVHTKHPAYFRSLPESEPFQMKMEPARIDRNALFAVNRHFDPDMVSQVRTIYHRAKLNFPDLRDDLLEYDMVRAPRLDSGIYYAALNSVIEDLSPPETLLIPMTHGAVAKSEDFPGAKSPGMPFKSLGYKNKREVVEDPEALKAIRTEWYDITFGKRTVTDLPDVMCFARAQICARDANKIRATWGFPLSVYLTEGQYFYPILKHLKSLKQPIIAYGVEIGNGGMHYLNAMSRALPGKTVLMGDWSRFDKTVPAWLIRDAFKILESWMDFSRVVDAEGNLWPVTEWQSKKRWKTMVNYFVNTPVRLCDGTRFRKMGGVPSGSCFTNVIDSICNAIVMRYLTYHQTGLFPLADIYLGDDSVVFMPSPIDIELFSKDAKQDFGMLLNAKKSYVTTNSENIKFLGYQNFNGTPVRSIDPLIASTIYPERSVQTKVETITRLIGQSFTVFNGTYSADFLRAAEMLRQEEGVSVEFLEQEMQTYPDRYKYLSHVGIDVRRISLPRVPETGMIGLRTLPGPPRRTFKLKMRHVASYATTPPWDDPSSPTAAQSSEIE